MANSLRILKMPLFLEFLIDSFKIYYDYNNDVSGEELLEYTELSRIKERHVWIDEFKKRLKELREVFDQEYMIKKN